MQYNGNTIVCKEHNKKVSLDCNGEIFFKITVDGEVEPSNTDYPRCDFMMIKDDESIEIYVELKGQDVAHAAIQIIKTIKKHGGIQAKKYSAIATSSIPSNSTALNNAKIYLAKETSCILFVKNNHLMLKYELQKIIKTN